MQIFLLKPQLSINLLWLTLWLLPKSAAYSFDLNAIRTSIFKINVISQSPQFDHPWLHGSQSSSSGTGFYIGGGRILTNAHVVANSRYISILRDGDDHPMIAQVQYIAHDSDLAVLTVDEPSKLKTALPLSIGGLPQLRKPVATIGYPLGGEQISVTEGIVSRISYRTYAHSGYYRHLLVQVDSAINPGNSGGPVVQGDYVVGVAFQAYDEAENTGYIIPPPVINRFLDDIKDGTYQGHPDIGLIVMPDSGENPALRAFHGLKDHQTGVKISFVGSYSAVFQKLNVGDIIMAIDDFDVGDDGKILFHGERVNFKTIYDLKQIGEQVTFTILRDQKPLKVKVDILLSKHHHHSSNLYPRFPRFEIYAGLVFSALSRDYLKVWGQKWYHSAPLHLRYAHWYYPFTERFANVQEIVVLSNRLPDPVNAEAEGKEEGIVDQINGVTINNLKDIPDALVQGDPDFIKIDLWQDPTPILIPREPAKAKNNEIIDRYGISPSSWLGETRLYRD